MIIIIMIKQTCGLNAKVTAIFTVTCISVCTHVYDYSHLTASFSFMFGVMCPICDTWRPVYDS